MKKLKLLIILFLSSLLLHTPVHAQTTGTYTTSAEDAAFEQIIMNEESIVFITSLDSLYENIEIFLPLLQLEDEAITRNINPDITNEDIPENESLIALIESFEEEGLQNRDNYRQLPYHIEGVYNTIKGDGTVIFIINGARVTETEGIIRAKFMNEEFFEAQIEDDRLIFDGVEYTLIQE